MAFSPTLTADVVSAMQRGVAEALEAPSGLDDAGRIDAIRSLEELVCTATAAQAQLAAELDASVRAARAEAGVRSAEQGRGIASEVAHARRESPHRGERHLGLARVVRTELPHTWAAWRAGHIPEWTATVIARETACLSLAHRLAVDEVVAGDPEHLEALGQRQLLGLLHAEAARLDPSSVVARRRRAESERTVTLRPAPDTMTWLTALLPVTEGVAAYAALIRAADTDRASGDERTKGQLMADSLVARVLGATAAATDPPPAHPVQLGLVMTDAALLGGSDEPAHLEGFGPIPAELAREIVSDALTRDEQVWVRRLYTSPTTGELVAMDARSRTFVGSLNRFVRLRDRICRTPWCDAPVRHVDHAVDHARGGPTSARNAQGLCEACNHAKQAPGWRARPSPDAEGHEVVTTLPTGHTYRSRAPALATVRSTPLTIDYVLAG
jgi:hypothetical protein